MINKGVCDVREDEENKSKTLNFISNSSLPSTALTSEWRLASVVRPSNSLSPFTEYTWSAWVNLETGSEA